MFVLEKAAQRSAPLHLECDEVCDDPSYLREFIQKNLIELQEISLLWASSVLVDNHRARGEAFLTLVFILGL